MYYVVHYYIHRLVQIGHMNYNRLSQSIINNLATSGKHQQRRYRGQLQNKLTAALHTNQVKDLSKEQS